MVKIQKKQAIFYFPEHLRKSEKAVLRNYMKINKINYNVPNNQITKQNNNKQSFKGLGPLDSGALFIADAIENGGLAVSFTLQDMLGTNLPRPIMGLMRNKKENKGKTNKSFAAKELVREMMTGPSMFIIPGGMLHFAKKIFGKAVNVPANVIKSLSDIHLQAVNAAGQSIDKQEFYKNAFAQMIKHAKSEADISEATSSKAAEFAEILADNITDKTKAKDAVEKISSEFVNISKKFAKDPVHTDFTVAALSDNVNTNVKDAISYITSYADDVVEKAKTQDAGKVKEFITKITNKKVIGRVAMNAAMYAAIMAFLQIIPKLYNKAEGKDNAGLKGLMKEETLKDKPAENIKDGQKDKSNPSFGSAAKIADALTGNGLAGKVAGGIEFSGCNLSFPLLVGVMLLGIIAPRVKNSKDKYDREEILRRDVVTCAVMCAGEKELRKGFSKLNENKSGFVLASKDKGFKDQSIFKRFWDYIRPINGVKVLSTEQIVSKYSNINAYKDGIKGFCDFIDGQGGNLAKVLGYTDESKAIMKSLFEKEGKDFATADNKLIKSVIDKAKDSAEVKQLTDLFHESYKVPIEKKTLLDKLLKRNSKIIDNPWVKKAKTLNARFTALSVLVLVPVFLGFLLPWINERTTKKKFAENNALNENNGLMKNKLPVIETPDLFKEIANFSK